MKVSELMLRLSTLNPSQELGLSMSCALVRDKPYTGRTTPVEGEAYYASFLGEIPWRDDVSNLEDPPQGRISEEQNVVFLTLYAKSED